MANIHSPITENELHAHVDGELPADRLEAVEAWLQAHPDDAERVAAWRRQADAIRARYGAVAAEPVPGRLRLDRLGRTGPSWTAIAAAAATLAFLVGGTAGWMARGASAAAPSPQELFTAGALEAYRLYVVEVRHPVEVPGAERTHLVQWLSKRLGYGLHLPDLSNIGLKLVGGRLLPGPTGPAAFFMYENADGQRFTLYCARTAASETAMLYSVAAKTSAAYWVDSGVAYVLSGPGDRDSLMQVAKAAVDQIDAQRGGGGGKT